MASMHFVGLDYPQEGDQLLHKGSGWDGAARWHGCGYAAGSGLMDEIPSSTMDRCDGSDHVHELDLRLLLPHAAAVKVAHPLMLRSIAAAKKKNDRIDARGLPTACAVIFSPRHTWHQQPFGSAGGRYAIASFLSARTYN